MRILGIDPGLTRLGFGLIDSTGPRAVSLVEVGILQSHPADAIEARIGLLGRELEKLLDRCKPDSIAIERLFAQSNLRSVMGVAQISGVVLNLAFQRDIPIAFHTPSEVKLAVSGSGRADKAQVAFMVTRILKLQSTPKPADAADALAIAICHAWSSSKPLEENSVSTAAQKKWLAELAKSKLTKG